MGGGAEEGESLVAAARREVREETGLVVDELGPVVLEEESSFEFDGVWLEQDMAYYLVRVPAPAAALDTSGWNDLERRALLELRWWTVADLAMTDETIYPETLLQLLRDNGIR